MSEVSRSSKYRSRPQAPVDDHERDQLSQRLNAAYTGGRLSDEEFTARLDQLFAAEHLVELIPVVDGLPPQQTYDDPDVLDGTTGSGTVPPGELKPARNATRLTITVVAGLALVVVVLAILLIGGL